MAGRKRSWTEIQLVEAVKGSFSFRQVLIKIGLIEAGGNYDQIRKYAKEIELDTSHFRGRAWNKGMRGRYLPIIPLSEILVKGSSFQSYKLKKRLFAEGLKSRE